MSSEPERIGDLIYQPNPEYPYPFPVERPPHYWMTEQTGHLDAAVEAYMNGDALTPEQIGLIRQYLQQYIERAMMTGQADRRVLLQRVAKLRNGRAIERLADELAEFGIEPF